MSTTDKRTGNGRRASLRGSRNLVARAAWDMRGAGSHGDKRKKRSASACRGPAVRKGESY